MTTRRTFMATLAAATPLRAVETRAEKGKRALQEVIAALGGDRFLQMRDRMESGRAYSFYREQLTGLSIAKIYTRYLPHAEPGKLGVQQRQTFGKKEDSSNLFLDGQGYEITFRGARPVPDAQLERYFDNMRHNFLYIVRMRLQEPGLQVELTGTDVVENQPVNIIDLFDSENENITVYVNSTTKLPTRQRWYRRDPATRERFEEITRFSKYRDGGNGAMWPLNTQRERDTEKMSEVYDESVAIDTGLKDSLFRLPSDIKLLSPEK